MTTAQLYVGNTQYSIGCIDSFRTCCLDNNDDDDYHQHDDGDDGDGERRRRQFAVLPS